MNIQSTRPAIKPAQTQAPQPPKSSPPQAQAPDNAFFDTFSGALETTVPISTAVAGAGWGGFLGTFAGTAIGAASGGVIGASAGLVIGFVGGAAAGSVAGSKVGKFAMKKAGQFGAAQNPENPAKGKAFAQAVAGGAITFMTATPLMTFLVVGGSAAYANHVSGD